MRFLVPAFLLLTVASTLVSSDSQYQADLLSVINNIKSIDMSKFYEIRRKVPTEVLLFTAYFDSACVIEKLGLNNVPQSSVHDIPNLQEFFDASSRNWKVVNIVENAARICSKSFIHSPNVGITQNIENREAAIRFIFGDAKSEPVKGAECFKWALSQNKPSSPLLKGFNVNSLAYTVDECKKIASLKALSNLLAYTIFKRNIKSCDAEAFGQPALTTGTMMEAFLVTLEKPKYDQYEAEVTAAAIDVEVKVLEGQIKCLLDDLKNE